MQVAGISALTAVSVLGQDPEVVGSPRWITEFDHLPGSYLDNLDVGGLLDDHLQDIKREMLEGDGRDRAGEDLGEGGRDHDVLDGPAKLEVKEEVAGYSSE